MLRSLSTIDAGSPTTSSSSASAAAAAASSSPAAASAVASSSSSTSASGASPSTDAKPRAVATRVDKRLSVKRIIENLEVSSTRQVMTESSKISELTLVVGVPRFGGNLFDWRLKCAQLWRRVLPEFDWLEETADGDYRVLPSFSWAFCAETGRAVGTAVSSTAANAGGRSGDADVIVERGASSVAGGGFTGGGGGDGDADDDCGHAHLTPVAARLFFFFLNLTDRGFHLLEAVGFGCE